MSSNRYSTALRIIKEATKNGLSIKRVCEQFGVNDSYIKDYVNRGDILRNLEKGVITEKQYKEFMNLYYEYKNNKGSNKTTNNSDSVIDISEAYNTLVGMIQYSINNNHETIDFNCTVGGRTFNNIKDLYLNLLSLVRLGKANITLKDFSVASGLYNSYNAHFNKKTSVSKSYDDSLNEKYDKRSTNEVVRNDDGKITHYTFKIMVRDEDDFVGELTREQMETIYANYPYVNQKTVSNFFPYLTFPQFKKILRCFNITKDSLFPQHILEEKTEEEAAQLALKHKEHVAYKKFVELKPIEIEKQLRDTQLELHKLKQKNSLSEDLIKDYISNLDTSIYEFNKSLNNQHKVTNLNQKGLFIYLSDMHIGAMNKGTQYSNEYNKEEYLRRLNVIIEESKNEIELHKPEEIFVVGLGDMIDGYNSTTTRGGHILPQNMNNKEQFTTYMNSIIYLFDELCSFTDAKVNFIHVGQSNHGGDFEYGANKALEHILPLKFKEQVSVRIFEKNIEHIKFGEHTMIYTHGKDTETMSRNMPMHLNANTEKYINDYIHFNKIKTDSVLFVKGDLHNHNSETTKNFKYINVPSVYGGSGYTDANFSYTKPATILHIVDKNKPKINEIYLELN